MRKSADEFDALVRTIQGHWAAAADPELPRRVLRLLAASRGGLTAAELEELTAPRFAREALDSILRALAPHLAVREEVLDFSTPELRQAARAGCFRDQATALAIHRDLAEYFRRKADPDGSSSWIGSSRGLSEMVYHQVRAEMRDAAVSALTDLKFIQARCEHGMVSDLQEDYQAALAAWPDTAAARDPVRSQDSVDWVPGWLGECTNAVLAGSPPMVPENGSGPVLVKLRALKMEERTTGPREAVCGQGKGRPPQDLFGPEDSRGTGSPAQDSVGPAGQDSAKSAVGTMETVRDFANFVAACGHVLASIPGETISIARNHAHGGSVAVQAEELAGKMNRIWTSSGRRPAALPRLPVVVRHLGNNRSEATAIALNASGTLAVSCGRGGAVQLWDTTTGRMLRVLDGLGGTGNAVAMTPDGRTVVAGEDGGAVQVWDAASGARRQTIRTSVKGLRSLAITADARIGLLAGEEKTARVWDLRSAVPVRDLEGHTEKITSLGITPDGRLAITGAEDGSVRIWDVERAEMMRTFSFEGHLSHRVAISANGRIAVSAFREYAVIWDVASGQTLLVGTCSEYPNHDPQGLLLFGGLKYDWVSAALSADGRTMVAASERGYMGASCVNAIWSLNIEAATMSCKAAGPSSKVHSMAVAADGRVCVVARAGCPPAVMNLASGQGREDPRLHDGPVTDISLSGIGKKKVVSVSSDYITCLSSLEDGKLDRTIDLRPGGFLDMWPHLPLLRQLRLTPDEGTAVCSSIDPALMVMEFGSRKVLRRMTGPGRGYSYARSFAVSPDGRLTADAAYGRKVACVYDVETGAVIQSHACADSPLVFVAVSPDGRFVCSNGTDRNIEAWDIRTSVRLASLPADADLALPVFVASDGRTASSADEDGTVYVWDVRTGATLRKVRTSCGVDVCRTLFSGCPFAVTPDCRYAVLADRSILMVWDTVSGRCVAGHPVDSPVTVISAVTHDGKFACGTDGGRVHCVALRNIGVEPPWHTPRRLFIRPPGEEHGHWDDAVSVICEWCGARFDADAGTLDAIACIGRDAGLSPDQSPCLALPDEAWGEERLSSVCPHCGSPIRFNPFVVDHRDRYPVEGR